MQRMHIYEDCICRRIMSENFRNGCLKLDLQIHSTRISMWSPPFTHTNQDFQSLVKEFLKMFNCSASEWNTYMLMCLQWNFYVFWRGCKEAVLGWLFWLQKWTHWRTDQKMRVSMNTNMYHCKSLVDTRYLTGIANAWNNTMLKHSSATGNSMSNFTLIYTHKKNS